MSDHEGIYPMYCAVYVQAILYEFGRADASFKRLTSVLQEDSDPAEVVASVHEAPGHTAALSRYVFPADKKPLARAREANLCKQFTISNTSPLSDRELLSNTLTKS